MSVDSSIFLTDLFLDFVSLFSHESLAFDLFLDFASMYFLVKLLQTTLDMFLDYLSVFSRLLYVYVCYTSFSIGTIEQH